MNIGNMNSTAGTYYMLYIKVNLPETFVLCQVYWK